MTPTKTTKKKRGPKKPMSPKHKAALAEGRVQSRAVRRYLDALEATKPKRGRKRTAENIQKQLDRIDADLSTARKLRQLALIQERINLLDELKSMGEIVDISSLEAEFIDVAKAYSERKNIGRAAWRQIGVSAVVLTKAGL